jgi:hypothetical protein
LTVARSIMQARVEQFEQTHRRQPTDFEFYVLWNAPAEVDHPVPCVVERARRFVNLVRRDELQAQTASSIRRGLNTS